MDNGNLSGDDLNQKLVMQSDICLVKKLDTTPQSAIIVTPYGEDDKHWMAEVVKVGPGRKNKKTGKRMSMGVKPGDKVLIGSYTGERHFMVEEVQELVAVREPDIVCVIE